jgi:hypothetical protein
MIIVIDYIGDYAGLPSTAPPCCGIFAGSLQALLTARPVFH